MKHQYHHYDDDEKVNRWLETAKKIPDLFLKLGVASVGVKATGHWSGALTALVGLKLATANNVAAGAAGVGTLTALGLGAGWDPEKVKSYIEPVIGENAPIWTMLNNWLFPDTTYPVYANPNPIGSSR